MASFLHVWSLAKCPAHRTVRAKCRQSASRRTLVVNAQLRKLDESLTIAVNTEYWDWEGRRTRYQCAGTGPGPALVLIHGFGANCDHWRKNIPALALRYRVFAIDLLGYGYSDKPDPRQSAPGSLYSFENWARQVLDFCHQVVNDRAFLICNSVGGTSPLPFTSVALDRFVCALYAEYIGLVGLQAAIEEPDTVRGLQLLNVSLRLLHIKKQVWYARPFVKVFQDLLRNTDVGKLFFRSIATPRAVKNILRECYHDDAAVTDELVDKILQPGLEPGAVDVFLDFIGYSGGPLPEELIPQVKCPVSILWGEKDPWEPIMLGKAFQNFDTVEEFVVLPNVGHCPQDEAPEIVNQLIDTFVSRHT